MSTVRVKPGVAVVLVAVLVMACASPSAPSTTVMGGGLTQSLAALTGPPSLPAWIANPQEIPSGLKGKNNCTFRFGPGATGGIWDYHADGACWERPGPDGWVRQHQNV